MKLKTKLASLIIGFVMVASMLFFGVWAASSANVTLGGTISFNSTNVHAQVSGSISGAATGNETLETLTFSSDANNQPDTSKWANKNLTFDEDKEIQIAITITNLASDRKLYASVTDTIGEVLNVEKTISDGADFIELDAASDSVNTDEVTVSITLKVKDTDLSVDETNYGYLVDLKDAAAFNTTETWAEEGWTVSVTDGVASVTAYSGSETNITIPDYVKNGDEILPITVLGGGDRICGTDTELITSINLSNITTIMNDALATCSKVTTIDLTNVVSVGDWAFNGAGLTNVYLPNVETIGNQAFSSASNLKTISIGSSLTSIGENVFGECTSLTDIYFEGTEEQWTAADVSNYIGIDTTKTTIHYNQEI